MIDSLRFTFALIQGVIVIYGLELTANNWQFWGILLTTIALSSLSRAKGK